jgi:hypothetical protein
VDSTTLDYVTSLACLLLNSRLFEFDEWQDITVPYLTCFLSEDGAQRVTRAFMTKCLERAGEAEEEDHGWTVDEEDVDKDELCNCR